MMLLQAQHLKKEYGIQEILDIEKLEIQDYDRIGLVSETARENPPCCPFWPGIRLPMKGTSNASAPLPSSASSRMWQAKSRPITSAAWG